jgi:hypothetical protein
VSDTYGVTPADVAAELPGLFAGGFSAITTPTDAQVASTITTADTVITLYVRGAVGQPPSPTDAAAPIAVRYILEWVKAQVIRVVYTGNDPVQVAQAAKPYDDLAQQLKDAITALGAQAEGEGEPAPRVVVSNTTPTRALLRGDRELDGCFNGRRRF